MDDLMIDTPRVHTTGRMTKARFLYASCRTSPPLHTQGHDCYREKKKKKKTRVINILSVCFMQLIKKK